MTSGWRANKVLAMPRSSRVCQAAPPVGTQAIGLTRFAALQ